MTTITPVKMGEMRTSHNPGILQSAGIGSCVVVVLYDPVAKLGAMAHAMLPKPSERDGVSTPLRYVPTAILAMITELEAMGAKKDRLLAKLVGGAHMFSIEGDGKRGIGAENIAAAREALQQQHIPIAAEEIGGSVGRTATVDLVSGICSVETKM